MKIKELKKWLNSLPAEFDSADFLSLIFKDNNQFPVEVFKIIAYKHKDKKVGRVVLVNPLDSSMTEEWQNNVKIVKELEDKRPAPEVETKHILDKKIS